MCKYIIKAFASKLADPDYFETDYPNEFEDQLIKTGWIWIETKEIKKHDKQIEGVLKRCRLGSKAQNRNLQIMYNLQA